MPAGEISCQHMLMLSPPHCCRVLDLQHPRTSTHRQFVNAYFFIRSLSWASIHRKQPIGSPKVNMALATRLYPLQPLLSLAPSLTIYLSGRLTELYVGYR